MCMMEIPSLRVLQQPVGDFDDYQNLVSAFRQVDVLISSITGTSLIDQLKLLPAIKEAGTIKRFIPSEFGNDVDSLEIDFEVMEGIFGVKRKVRREIEKSAVLNDEDDIATFTLKAADDQRAQNKVLLMRPKENYVDMRINMSWLPSGRRR
ncbi:hypothetical protein Mapa_017092 [Marchantia paleacea]|nr:hypothetical protein Mapa_017092 [Marchantia paleacea]